MKLFTASAIALLCGTSLAFAAENPSGRPGEVLNEDACQKAWKAADADGDKLSKDKASPFVLNFAAVDTSNDSEISKDEWEKGCKKGWISADADAENMQTNSRVGDTQNKSGSSDDQSGDNSSSDSSSN